MLISQTRYETPNASRYLQTLCKHLGNRILVEFDAMHGQAELSAGPAQFDADAQGLDIQVTGADADGLQAAQSVVERHLMRFAFREDPQPLTWSSAQ